MEPPTHEETAASAPPIVTELRAVEWELLDLVRRMDELRHRVHHLHIEMGDAEDSDQDTPRGRL